MRDKFEVCIYIVHTYIMLLFTYIMVYHHDKFHIRSKKNIVNLRSRNLFFQDYELFFPLQKYRIFFLFNNEFKKAIKVHINL